MANLFKMENKTIVCDKCKERPFIKTIKVNGIWLGVCSECDTTKEGRNEPKQA